MEDCWTAISQCLGVIAEYSLSLNSSELRPFFRELTLLLFKLLRGISASLIQPKVRGVYTYSMLALEKRAEVLQISV